jgi:phosphate-selective porin OprO/OprP
VLIVGIACLVSASRVSAAQAPAGAPTEKAPAPASSDAFAIQSQDGDYRLDIGLVAQADGRFVVDSASPVVSTFSIRKLRPTLSGRMGRYFDFKVMPDFGNGTAVVQDAYVDLRFASWLRVRSGKDKTPVGYELLHGDAFLLFPERSLASSLVPNRDIGLQAQGDLRSGLLSYAAGVFNGIPDGTSSSTEVDTNGGKDLAGRVRIQPLRAARFATGVFAGLGVHIGGSVGHQEGPLPAFRTSVGQQYFSYAPDAAASGTRRRVSPALFYYRGPFGGFVEYMRTTHEVAQHGVSQPVTTEAWEATGSLLVTGEPASERGVRPLKAFDPTRGQWGGVQLLSRYANLRVHTDRPLPTWAAATASTRAESFTLAVNWYPSAYIKYYVTFERTSFGGGLQRRSAERTVTVRTQIAF